MATSNFKLAGKTRDFTLNHRVLRNIQKRTSKTLPDILTSLDGLDLEIMLIILHEGLRYHDKDLEFDQMDEQLEEKSVGDIYKFISEQFVSVFQSTEKEKK
jgi:hypothetical protein